MTTLTPHWRKWMDSYKSLVEKKERLLQTLKDIRDDPLGVDEMAYYGTVLDIKDVEKEIVKVQCPGCRGETGWYSDDNGQWVSCLNCEEGRERHEKDRKTLEETRKIC